MSSSSPKKAAKKKAVSKASPKAEPSASVETPHQEPMPRKAAPADGVELARVRRIARAGLGSDRCALLGTPLDTGPRANPWQIPRVLGEEVVSALAAAIVESGVSPEALALGASRLRERGES